MRKKNIPGHAARLENRFPGFEKSWSKLLNEVGIDVVNFIKQQITSEYLPLKNFKEFKFRIIVDNNFVFGQIKGTITKEKKLEESFLFKLLTSSCIEMFGPYLLKEELIEKVNTVLNEDQRELGVHYATKVLAMIKIQDAQWTDNWKKANNLIGEKDPDDVSYLALAFELGVHSIVSHDDVFHKQGEINVWKHNDVGSVVANYNSGFVSMVLMDRTGQLLWKIIAVVFKFVRDILIDTVKLLVMMAKGLIKGVAQLPVPVLLGLVGLGIIFWDEIKQQGKEFFAFVIEKGRELLIHVKTALKEIIELLQKALDVLKLGATVTFEFVEFLLNEYFGLYDKVKDLNIEFPEPLIPRPKEVDVPVLPNVKFGVGLGERSSVKKTSPLQPLGSVKLGSGI